jgi:hypothetical protein
MLGENAKDGTTFSQARRHACPIAGHRLPHSASNCAEAATEPTQNAGGLDDDKTALPICPPARQEHPEQPLTRAEAWTPQCRELMAQGDKFQHEVKALAEPRPHCRKPSKDPSRHEL